MMKFTTLLSVSALAVAVSALPLPAGRCTFIEDETAMLWQKEQLENPVMREASRR
jgi:hypothetical protein